MALHTPPTLKSRTATAHPLPKLGFNADIAAIGIALLLAALVRLNVVPHIGW